MKLVLIAGVILLTGCSSILQEPNEVGYRDYDPCIRCGEGWIFLPNPSHSEQLQRWKKENNIK